MAKKDRNTESQKQANHILGDKALMARIGENVKTLTQSYKSVWKGEVAARPERFRHIRAILKAVPDITGRCLTLVMFGTDAFGDSSLKGLAGFTNGSLGRLLILAGKTHSKKDGTVISRGLDYGKINPETEKPYVTEKEVAKALETKGELALVNQYRKEGLISAAKPREPRENTVPQQLDALTGTTLMRTCTKVFQGFIEKHAITKENAPYVIEAFNALKPLYDAASLMVKRMAA